MWDRRVQRIPIGTKDALSEAVAEAEAMSSAIWMEPKSFSVELSDASSGWVEMMIMADDNTVGWYLPDIPDPFGLEGSPPNSTQRYFTSFRPWLEAIVTKSQLPIAFDMEGTVGVMLPLSGPDDVVHLRMCQLPNNIVNQIKLDKSIFVRSLYEAIEKLQKTYAVNDRNIATSWRRSSLIEDWLRKNA